MEPLKPLLMPRMLESLGKLSNILAHSDEVNQSFPYNSVAVGLFHFLKSITICICLSPYVCICVCARRRALSFSILEYP